MSARLPGLVGLQNSSLPVGENHGLHGVLLVLAGDELVPVLPADDRKADTNLGAVDDAGVPCLAERGCTVSPDVRLRTLADVVDHLGASGTTGIIDGTEIRVRRPAAGRKDRDKFISGKNKQNAVKSMVVTDAEGRVLNRSGFGGDFRLWL